MMLKASALVALFLAATPVAAEPLRILAFGDSLTEGYGLRHRDGLVPQLQNWLDARGHEVVVLNGGLSGDTTAGGRVRIGYSLARHKPDAVIVELGGNDLLMGFSPKMVEKNLDSILDQAGADLAKTNPLDLDRTAPDPANAAESGPGESGPGESGPGKPPLLLVGIASPELDADAQRQWAEMWPRLAARHDTLLMPNLYQPLFDLPGDGYKALLQEDGLHASAAGVQLIVESLGPKVEQLIARAKVAH